MKPASLLRWYPRAWRDRSGEELLALIQDTLDEGRPGWRLWLGVIRAACVSAVTRRGRRPGHPQGQAAAAATTASR